jgi:hypothetical protein
MVDAMKTRPHTKSCRLSQMAAATRIFAQPPIACHSAASFAATGTVTSLSFQ